MTVLPCKNLETTLTLRRSEGIRSFPTRGVNQTYRTWAIRCKVPARGSPVHHLRQSWSCLMKPCVMTEDELVTKLLWKLRYMVYLKLLQQVMLTRGATVGKMTCSICTRSLAAKLQTKTRIAKLFHPPFSNSCKLIYE